MQTFKPFSKAFIILTLGVFLLSSCDKPTDSSSSDTSGDTSSSSDTSANTSSDTSANTSTGTSSNTSSSSGEESNHYPMPEKYASYYSTLSSSPTSTQLRGVVSTHTKISYSAAADAMTQTDRDWNLSPNKSDANPYMRLIYASYNFSTSTAADRSDYTTIWDKEHIWAKSHGNFDTGDLPGCDLHHLRASDKPNNNNHRNSRNFGTATGGTVGKDYRNGNSGKYTGSSTSGIYEPLDQDKGDVARACFYMALVYPSNCVLVSSYPNSGGTSLGHLATLLQWHELDPVDEFEMNRNNIIYDSYQNNRNPFIDHPEWADSIY